MGIPGELLLTLKQFGNLGIALQFRIGCEHIYHYVSCYRGADSEYSCSLSAHKRVFVEV